MRTGPRTRTLEALAAEGSIPVFNMLTAATIPSQALADLMTLQEAFPDTPLDELRLAYVGDGNNVARSLALLGGTRGSSRRRLAGGLRARAEAGGTRTQDPREAVAGAHAIYTDVWVSMGDEDTADARRAALAAYRIDDELLDAAAPGRDRPALPPRPPGRGDHRRRPLRRAPADLGPGGEPPPRPEGAAGMAARRGLREDAGDAAAEEAHRQEGPRQEEARQEGRGEEAPPKPRKKPARTAAPAPRSAKAAPRVKPKPAQRRSKRTAAARSQTEAARDVALFDNLGAIKDVLAEHLVLSAERLQETLDDAVRRGRMLPTDAQELAERLTNTGRRQLEELLE